jgi:uncharacterized paraquat-inducible protein A
VHPRGTFTGRTAPGPFHCLSCQTYVTGTESGHCPRCGFVPPALIAVSDRPEEQISRTHLVAALLLAAVSGTALAVAFALS